MNRKYFALLTVMICIINGLSFAQPGPSWPRYKDYVPIELNLLLKSSNGNVVYFDTIYYYNLIPYSTKSKHGIVAVYNRYCLGSGPDWGYQNNPKYHSEMEEVYKSIYENHPDDYIERIKKIFTSSQCFIWPNSTKVYSKYEDALSSSPIIGDDEEWFENETVHAYKEFVAGGFPFDTLCYRYLASDNFVYSKRAGGRIETPYFVPIGDLDLNFVEDNKLMQIKFELYNYKKFGFSQLTYNQGNGKFLPLKLFMEIQFQEGEFVVTDESYPNLVRRK